MLKTMSAAIIALSAALFAPCAEAQDEVTPNFEFDMGGYHFRVPRRYVPSWTASTSRPIRLTSLTVFVRWPEIDGPGFRDGDGCHPHCPDSIRVIVSGSGAGRMTEHRWQNRVSETSEAEGGAPYGLHARISAASPRTVFFGETAADGTFLYGRCDLSSREHRSVTQILGSDNSICTIELDWRRGLSGSLLFRARNLADWREMHVHAASLIARFID